MTIPFINGDGGGVASPLEVSDNTTIGQLFDKQLPGCRESITPNPAEDADYPTTLFEDARAHPAPYTGRSTLYAASIAAGLMLNQFAQVLRGQVPARDVLLQRVGDERAVL